MIIFSLFFFGGGFCLSEGVFSPKLYVDVPAGSQKFDFLYTNFLNNYPPIGILFLKAPTFDWIGCFFTTILLKIQPIYVIWAPLSLIRTYRSLGIIRQAHTMSMRTPQFVCFLFLRGYCTPGLFLDCFCIFLKNYNTLVTSKICFL